MSDSGISSWTAADADIGEIVNILATAFRQDPAIHWWFNDPASRDAQLRWFYAFYVKLKPETCFRDRCGPGLAVWYPPGNPPLHTLWAELRAGLLGAPLGIGLDATLRGLRLDEAIKSRLEKVVQPCWYLDTLAVHPDAHGQGHGGKLLRHGLARAGEQPVFLYTIQPKNLPIYAHYGFEVIDDRVLIDGGPVAWTMMKPGSRRDLL